MRKTSTEKAGGYHCLCFFGFAALSLLIIGLLASRLVLAGRYVARSFLKDCLAACGRLMTLQFSPADGLRLFAVLALLFIFIRALVESLSQANRVRIFSASMKRVGLTPRLLRLLEELGLKSGRVVLFPSRLSFACTAGLFSPRILLSTRLVESLGDEEVKAVLRHEQSHLRRWDPLRGVLVHFLSQFFFIFPGVDRLLKRLRLDWELKADRYALSFSRSPSDLASALVKISRKNLSSAGNAPAFAGDGFLSERLSRILNIDFRTEHIPLRRRLSARRALAGIVLVLSLVVLVLPPEKGFLKTTPWRCPHAGRASCCPMDGVGGQLSRCRS